MYSLGGFQIWPVFVSTIKKITCLAVIIMICGLACARSEIADKVKSPGEKNMNEKTNINSRFYADLQSSSYLPLSGSLKGDILWHQMPDNTTSGRMPIHLALRDNILIIRYIDYLEARNSKDGSILWGRETSSNIAFDMTEEGIATLDHAGYYELLDYDGQVKWDIRLPFLVDEPFLEYADIDATELRYIYYSMGTADSEPDREPAPLSYGYSRYRRQPSGFIWSLQDHGALINACLNPNHDRVFLISTDRLYSFPADADSSIAVAKLEFENILAASLNHHGDLLLLLTDEETTRLKLLSPDGEQQWEFPVMNIGEVRQPPGSSPNGRVFLAFDESFICLADGELLWKYKSGIPADESFFTVLADNTALIGFGSILVHLSDDGSEILRKILPGKVTCRPIIDGQGRLYIGLDNGVYCFE